MKEPRGDFNFFCTFVIMKNSLFFLLIFLISISFWGCNGNNLYRSADGMVWNTTYHIVFQGDASLSDSIVAVLDDVGASLNFFNPESRLSIINQSDTAEIDNHFRKVYEMSQLIYAKSDGRFDPTLTPLITAWGFGKGHTATADTLKLDSLLALTGIRRTHIEGNLLIKQRPEIMFNFSAVAKGYGCDCVAEMFHRNGVKNFLIEIGGEIMAEGVNKEGGEWRISIDRPLANDKGVIHESQAVVGISGMGMATSGNYRNFHTSGGRKYGHTISARTGRPVETDVLSATVVAPNAMQADAMATACMALGSGPALYMCGSLDCPVYLILADTILMSPSFKSLLK